MHRIENWGLLGALVILLGLQLFAIIWYPTKINHDVSIYVEIGHKILDGQLPYVDFFEINLPMMHYLAAIPAFIARVTGIASVTVMQGFVWVLSALSVGLSYWLSRRYWGRNSLVVYAIPLALALSTYLMVAWPDYPRMRLDFGQREHLFVLLFWPAILSRALDWDSRPLSPVSGFVLGVLAGIGVTIKPYFLLVPVLIELGFMIQNRTIRPRMSWTAFGFISFGLLHVAYLLFAPGVLAGLLDTLRLVREGYRSYLYQPFIDFVMDIRLQLAAVVVISLWFWPIERNRNGLRLARIMGSVAIAGIIIATIQEKGWTYHFLPFEVSTISMVFLVIFVLIEQAKKDIQMIGRWFSGLITAVVIVLAIQTTFYKDLLAPPALPEAFHLIEQVTEPEEPILILSERTITTYPWLGMINRRQAASYLVAHPLPMAYFDNDITPLTTPQNFPPAVQQFVDQTRADLQAGYRVIGFSPLIHDFLITHGLYEDLIATDYAMLYGHDDHQIYIRIDDLLRSDDGFVFGDQINLNGWRVNTPAEIRACDTITIETVWSADTPLNTAYSLTVVLADERGGIVQTDSTPSHIETTDWMPARHYYDQRPLTVPCDLPAGDYSLLFSLYDPQTDDSNLSVVDPSGNGIGAYLFVQTVSVSE